MDLKEKLQNYLDSITDTDLSAWEEAEKYSMGLLKIPMSLGGIEKTAFKLASVTGKVKNTFDKKCILVMSADNGVVSKGVSSAPQSVTVTMTECFTKNVTGVGVIAKVSGADLIVYDVGINGDIQDAQVHNKKIMRGTNDFSEGPAMSEESCLKAVFVGIEAVRDAIDQGYQVIGTGEMGIGNTSSSTCIVSVLTDTPVEDIVGKGTGMSSEQEFENKINILKKAIEVNKPDPNDIIDVISKVGGLDIAALTGVFIGCAYYKVPVVIDGYISSAAALCAYLLNRKTYDYMFESHYTAEPGYSSILKVMPLDAPFRLNMRLGEGSGCPLEFFVMDCANAMMNNMYTFEEGMISTEYSSKVSELEF